MPPLLFYFIIQETRIKFPENPEKFMESEMELHDALQVLIYLSMLVKGMDEGVIVILVICEHHSIRIHENLVQYQST